MSLTAPYREFELTSAQRKTVAPKKNAGEGDAEPSPSKVGGINAEDHGRLVDMEHRVRMLEDQLAKALDDVHDARSREAGTMNLIREIIGHMATGEKGELVGSWPEGFS